jgi:hypothetical protein
MTSKLENRAVIPKFQRFDFILRDFHFTLSMLRRFIYTYAPKPPIEVTHPPLPAIHLLPAIHILLRVLLHFLLAIDPDLLPVI